MSSTPCPPLPSDTARATEAAFGRDHPCLLIGDSLEILWRDLGLSAFDSPDTFLAGSLYPYFPATVVQYWEHLTDQQMSQATRTRPELKYALHFSLNHPGVDAHRLCTFRQHLLSDPAAQTILVTAIQRLGSLAYREYCPADIDQIISSLCLPSRFEIILESMETALEAAATRDPRWLIANTRSHWYQRYHQKSLRQKIPQTRAEIIIQAEAVGNDGWHLLQAIEASDSPALARLPEIQMLRREWRRQFEWGRDTLKLRNLCSLSCGHDFQFISSHSGSEEGGRRGTMD